jgi:hypothetical protein
MVISGLVFLLLVVLPDYFLKDILLHRLQAQLGQPVTVDRVSASLIPPVRLSLFRVASRPANDSADVFYADRIDVVLSVFSWLSGGAAVEKLVIDAPRLVVRRDENGRWSIPLLASAERTRPTKMRPADSPVLPVLDLQVMKGTVRLVDAFTSEEPKSREIAGVQASLTVDQPAQRADMELSAFLPSTSQLSTISLVGELTPIGYSGTDRGNPLRFSGAVQAGGIDVRQIASLFLPPSAAEALTGTAHLGAEFLLVPRQMGHELLVQNFSIESGAIVLTGSANFAGLGTETTGYALTIASKPVTVQQLLERVPIDWIPLQWQVRLVEDQPDGTLTLLGATVTSMEAASAKPEWTAEAMLTGGRLIAGSGRTPIQDLSARILLKPDQLGVTELRAASGGVQVTEGTVVVSDLRNARVVDLTAAGRAEVDALIQLISAMWPSAGVSEVIGPVQEVSGNLDLRIHAGGSLSRDGIKLIEGQVDAHDVAFRTSALPLPVHHLSGRIGIEPERVDIEALRWLVGSVPVEAWGRIDVAKTARFHDVELLVDVEAHELAAQFAGGHDRSLPSAWNGPVRLRTTLSGPVTSPHIVGLLDLKDVRFSTHGFDKQGGTPAALEFNARLSPTKVLDVKRLDVIVPPARLTARGSARLSETSFDGTIRLQPTAIRDLPPGIALGPVTAGTLSADVRVKGQSTNWTAWSIDGWMKFDEGAVALPNAKAPFDDLAIHLTFNDDTVLIPQAGFTAGDSAVRASGSIRRWRQAPRMELDVVSPNLDLGLLSPRTSGDQQKEAESSSWLGALTVTASLQIQKARYDQLQLTNVTGRLLASEGLIRLDGLTADTEQGRFAGEATGRLPQGTAPTIEGFLKVNGVPVGRVLGLFGRENRLNGWLSVDGALRAEEAGVRMTESLTSLSDIRVLIQDGRILHSPLIARMLKLVNLPALVGDGEVNLDREGIPFNRLSGLFAVDQGLIKVKELYLEGPVLKISGAGSYDAVSDRLELAMAMNPLQSYSTLLGKIPLIGRLLSGKREGLGATLYEVTGSLQDPQLRILPAESLGGGVSGFARLAYDILVNAAKLPADLLTSPQRILEPDRP